MRRTTLSFGEAIRPRRGAHKWLFSRIPSCLPDTGRGPQTAMLSSGQWPGSSGREVREAGRSYILWSRKGAGWGVRAQVQICPLSSHVTLGEPRTVSEPHLHKGIVTCGLAASQGSSRNQMRGYPYKRTCCVNRKALCQRHRVWLWLLVILVESGEGWLHAKKGLCPGRGVGPPSLFIPQVFMGNFKKDPLHSYPPCVRSRPRSRVAEPW